jgi:hypothetical protein
VAESDAASALEDAGIGALPFRTAQLRRSLTLTVSFVTRPSAFLHKPTLASNLLLLLLLLLLLS